MSSKHKKALKAQDRQYRAAKDEQRCRLRNSPTSCAITLESVFRYNSLHSFRSIDSDTGSLLLLEPWSNPNIMLEGQQVLSVDQKQAAEEYRDLKTRATVTSFETMEATDAVLRIGKTSEL